jgi:hypothetical protein
MRTQKVTFIDLRMVLKELKYKFTKLVDEDLFVLWFILASIKDDDQQAADAITNGPNDIGLDAIFIDDPARIVCLVQGKYRREIGKKNEVRGDILDFAHKAHVIGNPRKENFRDSTQGANPLVITKLKQAQERVQKHGYRVGLYYATLGKCSPSLRREAEKLRDYLDGAAPPIPNIDLEMEKGSGVAVNGIYQRYDNRSDIESWAFSMKGDAIANLVNYYGGRLFARNIRGFMGENTPVNRGMKNTLESEAEHFFYYNNGLTIICDNAEKKSHKGKDILNVSNPQIINGLQTARILTAEIDKARKASVLVKVIQIPRDIVGGGEEFDTLVSRIVAGTNWQNAIRPPDLMSNDRRQIEIERELRKYRYLYLRKRQSRTEAKANAGGKYYWTIYKEELAQIVAGCDLDPLIVRAGKDKLFEEKFYDQVFPNSDPNYYLPRYWLAQEVTYRSTGYPERGYAKWMVLNFVWSNLAPLVKSSKHAEVFRIQEEEQEEKMVVPLSNAVNKVFLAALRFYRKNSGEGPKRLDISTFFRTKSKLDKEFEGYWQTKGNNGIRKDFDRVWKKVEERVLEWER